MGLLKSIPSARYRCAACFLLSLIVTSLIFAAMYWIIWCYFGLTAVQVSDSQRRALVNYSYSTPKPATTSRPVNRTEVGETIESSLNAISKSPVTPPSQHRRRNEASGPDLAKGDFASRPQAGASQNSTRRGPITPPLATPMHDQRASIVNGGEEDVLNPRKVSTSNTQNRPHEESARDIKPTQTYAPAQSDPVPVVPKDERRPISGDSDQADEIQSSRPAYRDPDFEREPPPRRSELGRRRYDDDYDDRGSASRYDKRDRGRDTDDRYSKGDTRVYPDERPRLDDRYPYRDDERRRGDDRDREDRYRDREDRYKEYDDRYKERDDRYRYKDDPYRDDSNYRNEKPFLDDDRDRRREEERNRRRDDDRYRYRDDRYHYDDRYRPREDRYRDDEKDRDTRYDERRDTYIPRDDGDRYTRSRDRDYRESIVSSRPDVASDRKSGRPVKDRRPSDYDLPVRDRSRTSYIDESRADDRYLDEDDKYRRPSRHDDRDRIFPTKTRDETYISRSTAPLSRSRDDAYSVVDERKRNDDRYSNSKDRSQYYDDDNHRTDEPRYISPSSVREIDSVRRNSNTDDYRTRLPNEKRLDDVGVERRSHSAEEEEYKRQNSRTRYSDDTDRKPSDDSRRGYRTDDEYTRNSRIDGGEYIRSRPRGDYDTHRSRVRDRYDDRYIDEEGKPTRRYYPEYDEPRRSEPDIGLRKEVYHRDVADEDRRSQSPNRRPERDRKYDEDLPPRRPTYDDEIPRSRPDTIDDRPLRPAVERPPDTDRPHRDDTYTEDERRYKEDTSRQSSSGSERRDPFLSSSSSPRDAVLREKKYHNSGKNFDEEERQLNAKDVLEAAIKLSDTPNQNSRKVSYPVFDPRVSNLTSIDIIPHSDRRGTTITSRRRRRRTT